MALITITQSMGCAGEEIAKLVAANLNLELYDDNKLQQTALDAMDRLSLEKKIAKGTKFDDTQKNHQGKSARTWI